MFNNIPLLYTYMLLIERFLSNAYTIKCDDDDAEQKDERLKDCVARGIFRLIVLNRWTNKDKMSRDLRVSMHLRNGF